MTTQAGEQEAIAEAYRACEAITRREARNFSYGIRLLPPAKRRALSAVYALARRIDDIGDGQLPAERKLALLDGVRAHVRAVGDGSYDRADPVLVAVAATHVEHALPLPAFEEIVAGCEADVRGTAYPTFAATEHYCRCVAGSVGRLSLGVFGVARDRRGGVRAEDAERLADTLGVALQITNILRDIREDRATGRVYLPAEDLARYGCTFDTDSEGRLTDEPDRLAALVEFEAARAEERYAEGLRLLGLLDHRSAACVAAMAGIYHRLLHRIRQDPLQVLRTRVRLSGWEKARVAARALARGRA